ncbi:thymopoietin a isoform X5 [Xyrichtys novacula]|uniref:Thymopoietin a isoform X5 n=1 Tax=Xyrichtys novacula TaxID=13765 RepID=A0AAV1F3E1_XYRNO|nr:thymopoietin a isoform X5 [Xyrichtys novacula]
MPEYLDDPSVLTKDKLKSELLAHNVELPSGNQTKDVYVQLYLKNLTAQNNQHDTAASLDAFSSDEELPPPVVVSSRSRSSGRKAVRKTDKVRAAELDVTELTDQDLKDELLKHGVDAGPIVATTRKLYEKKLQKLLDNGPAQVTQLVVTEIQVNHNGNSESEVYSDKEDEVTPEPEPEPIPEPEPEPEPVPVVERPIRSRGKTPVTTRTSSSSKHKVEKIAASEPTPKVDESDVLKELFPNDINSPTGITATCRRPIRGAAGRPIKPSDLWNDENVLFSPKTAKSSSSSSSSSSFYTESHIINRVSSLPPSTSSSSSFTSSSSSSRPLSAAPPAAQTKAAPRRMSLWVKLLLLAVVAAFLFLVYQAMETDTANPFESATPEVASDAAA